MIYTYEDFISEHSTAAIPVALNSSTLAVLKKVIYNNEPEIHIITGKSHLPADDMNSLVIADGEALDVNDESWATVLEEAESNLRVLADAIKAWREGQKAPAEFCSDFGLEPRPEYADEED